MRFSLQDAEWSAAHDSFVVQEVTVSKHSQVAAANKNDINWKIASGDVFNGAAASFLLELCMMFCLALHC